MNVEFWREIISKLPMNVGFGRDIVTKAYKVFLMYGKHSRFGPTIITTKIFDISNDKERCSVFPSWEYISNKITIHVNGSLYFWNKFRTIAALDLHTEQFSKVLVPSSLWDNNDMYCSSMDNSNLYLWSLKDRLCLSDVRQYPDVDVWGLKREGHNEKWEKFLSVTGLSIDCLNAKFWNFGLAACYFGPIVKKQSKKPFEDALEDHYSTALCTEDLLSWSNDLKHMVLISEQEQNI